MAATPIETIYRGHRFRSRTEARWAVAFDAYEIQWQYEPEGYRLPSGPYLPDFWLPQVSMFAEVKGKCFADSEVWLCHELAQATGHPCLLLEGPPDLAAYWAVEPHDSSDSSYEWNFALGDGRAVQGMDYTPFSCEAYHLDEDRFFSCCGVESPFPRPNRLGANQGVDIAPVTAARRARFEHHERDAMAEVR